MIIENSTTAMTGLCQSFPTLQGMPGTAPWNQHAFADWLRTSPAVTSGSACAGRFVLEVWNGGYPSEGLPWWKLSAFNTVDALAVWDNAHRVAFIQWCQDPFWP